MSANRPMEIEQEYIWTLKAFSELSPNELYSIIQLRMEVFMLEQNCLYAELDRKDAYCRHLFAQSIDNESVVAYARIVPADISYPQTPSIGRVVVHPIHRGKNMGRALMERAITATSVLNAKNPGIRISAQAHLFSFYNSLGFEPEGEIYDEDGIPHIQMFRQ